MVGPRFVPPGQAPPDLRRAGRGFRGVRRRVRRGLRAAGAGRGARRDGGVRGGGQRQRRGTRGRESDATVLNGIFGRAWETGGGDSGRGGGKKTVGVSSKRLGERR